MEGVLDQQLHGEMASAILVLPTAMEGRDGGHLIMQRLQEVLPSVLGRLEHDYGTTGAAAGMLHGAGKWLAPVAVGLALSIGGLVYYFFSRCRCYRRRHGAACCRAWEEA